MIRCIMIIFYQKKLNFHASYSYSIDIFHFFVYMKSVRRIKNNWIYKGMSNCPYHTIVRPVDS